HAPGAHRHRAHDVAHGLRRRQAHRLRELPRAQAGRLAGVGAPRDDRRESRGAAGAWVGDGVNGGETMSDVRRFTAMIYREGDGFVALCPELDVASQGNSVEDASENLREAVELFIESADDSEIERRDQ